MAEIAAGIIRAVEAAGFGRPRVNTVLSPAWTTDFMTAAARRALREYGIAPPPEAAARRPRFAALPLPCPRCGSAETEELAPFGATACKALWRCRACREPFEHFKCH
jgi:ring-1,2-phenylacetyl-CoA epoxidase subunit PaaD